MYEIEKLIKTLPNVPSNEEGTVTRVTATHGRIICGNFPKHYEYLLRSVCMCESAMHV